MKTDFPKALLNKKIIGDLKANEFNNNNVFPIFLYKNEGPLGGINTIGGWNNKTEIKI